MKHIKIFEAEVVKSFTDWIKNPKKPVEEKWVETDYIYSCPIIKELTLVDNGDFTTMDLLEYIKDEHAQDIITSIARDNDMTVNQLKRDPDLDDKFEEFLKSEYSSNSWSKFLDEYFVIEDYVDSDIDYDPIIKALAELNTTFEEEDASFRVKSIEFVYPQDIRNFRTNESINIYFKVITSRPLRDDEEKQWVISYVENVANDLEYELNRNPIRVDRKTNSYHLKFSTEYILSHRDRIHGIEDWNIKLVQTKKLQP